MSGQQMNPFQQNAMARQNLLATGISMIKQLGPVNGALGSQVKIPLLRMGIMTGVLLQFTVPVNVTAAATASLVAPHNIAQMVTYNDFAGTQRTRTNGYQLFAAQCMKQGDVLSAVPSMAYPGSAGPAYNYDTNILAQPVAVGAGEIKFSLYVPMANDPASDLTGAVLTQTNVGEHYITVQLANALVNADPWIAPYTAGTVTNAGGVTIEAFQMYIQPQSMDAMSLPVIDLSTVYGFEGAFQNTANIGANQETLISFPNNRSILSTLVTFENGSAFTANGADLSKIRLLANSNTNFREMTPRMLREQMRNQINSDLPPGSYYIGSRRQPILTQLYANVQAGFQVASVTPGGVTQFNSQFEVMYPSGSPLPGVTVAA